MLIVTEIKYNEIIRYTKIIILDCQNLRFSWAKPVMGVILDQSHTICMYMRERGKISPAVSRKHCRAKATWAPWIIHLGTKQYTSLASPVDIRVSSALSQPNSMIPPLNVHKHMFEEILLQPYLSFSKSLKCIWIQSRWKLFP